MMISHELIEMDMLRRGDVETTRALGSVTRTYSLKCSAADVLSGPHTALIVKSYLRLDCRRDGSRYHQLDFCDTPPDVPRGAIHRFHARCSRPGMS